jgi:hypothetical protein
MYIRPKNLIPALLLLATLFTPWSLNAQDYPRLSNYYLSAFTPAQNAVLAPQLARYDLLVLDMEMGATNPQALDAIRQLNPSIKILAYMTCQQITTLPIQPSTQPLRYVLNCGIDPSWWLLNASGEPVSCWPQTRMLNCSDQCPMVDGQTWSSYFAGFVNAQVLSNPRWDGFFVDNCWSEVAWVDTQDNGNTNIDCDNDGVSDNNYWLDAHWRFGMEAMLDQLRQANPDKTIAGNGGYAFGQCLNGSMLEEWDELQPDFGFGMSWAEFAWLQQDLAASHQAPLCNMIAARQPNDNPSNYRHMRFTLAAALLGTSYFGIDKGPEAHADTWWYDEFDVNLGQPLENVNALEAEQVINGGFENLDGWSAEVISPLDPTNALTLGNEAGNTFALCQIAATNGQPWRYALKQVNNPALLFYPGERYAFSFRAKASSNRLIELAVSKNFGDYGWVHDGAFVYLGTEWRDYKFVFIPTLDNILPPEALRLAFFLGGANGNVCIDDVSLRHIDAGHVFLRHFTNGLAICNPTAGPVNVSLPDTYYHLSGTQDPLVNNGQPCTSVTLQAWDGLILLSSPPQPLASPQVNIELVDQDIRLSWSAVPQAATYRVESSQSPLSAYTTLGVTADTWFQEAAGVRRFYRVIAQP